MIDVEENQIGSLNHFALAEFKDAYWSMTKVQKEEFHSHMIQNLRFASRSMEIYQATESGLDLLIWSAVEMTNSTAPAVFFEKFTRALAPFRHLIEIKESLWGITHPSQYSKARSKQEINPFALERLPYLVIYPFSKTIDWYLMGRESRQGMMNEHIRIGKQYVDISQLLLYSFGLQNQEFVVVYETSDLFLFSNLVNELRDTDGRRYTLKDTPIHTAIYHPAEETLALWK